MLESGRLDLKTIYVVDITLNFGYLISRFNLLGKMNMMIDKEKLTCIIQQLHADKGKSFNDLYWGQCLKKIPTLKEICLNGIGDISIPISKEVCVLNTKLLLLNDCKLISDVFKDLESIKKHKQRHSLLNSSRISLDAVSTSLAERTFRNSAFLAINSVLEHAISSNDVDIALELNQLAIKTPLSGGQEQNSLQKPGTVIKTLEAFQMLMDYVFSCRSSRQIPRVAASQRWP